jgi:hypothetical protein
MKVGRIRPSGAVLIAVVALVIGLEAPAMAHQVVHKIDGSTLKANSVTGKQIKESTLGTVPRAATLPALKWHKIALINSWANASSKRPASWAVDAQGIVHLRGEIKDGAAFHAAFDLPAAVAPEVVVMFPVAVNGVDVGILDLGASGQAIPYGPDGAEIPIGQVVVLDGVTYSVK